MSGKTSLIIYTVFILVIKLLKHNRDKKENKPKKQFAIMAKIVKLQMTDDKLFNTL